MLNWPGEFVDPDRTDEHTVVVDWGDGTVDEWVPPGRFTGNRHGAPISGQSRNSRAIPEPIYPIHITIRDDAGGVDEGNTATEAWNVAPEITPINEQLRDGGIDVVRRPRLGLGSIRRPRLAWMEFEGSVTWGDGTEGALQVYSFLGKPLFLRARTSMPAPASTISMYWSRDDDFGRASASTNRGR